MGNDAYDFDLHRLIAMLEKRIYIGFAFYAKNPTFYKGGWRKSLVILKEKMTYHERDSIEKEALEKGLLQFRTFDKHVRNALINNEIIFGAAKNFNDPFDCNLPIDLNNSLEQIYDYLNQANKKFQFNKDYIQKLAKHYFDNKDELEKKIRFLIYDFRRLSCFHIDASDEVHKNSFFWANYAGKHKGLCMKFNGDIIDTHEQLLVSSSENISSYPIDYVECIPTFNYVHYRIMKEQSGPDYAKRLYGYTPSEFFLQSNPNIGKMKKKYDLFINRPMNCQLWMILKT